MVPFFFFTVDGSLIGWSKFPSRQDQLKRKSIAQIWVVTRHQHGISALVSQTSLRGKPVVASWSVGCFLRLCTVEFEYTEEYPYKITSY